MGLLFDDEGSRFTPSHANKKGRRYRYYVFQAVILNTKTSHPGPVRIPATETEELVTSELKLLLQSPQRLMDILAGESASPEEVHAVAEASRQWSAAASDKVQDFLRSTVKRIVVHNEQMGIEISKSALQQAMLNLPEDVAVANDDSHDLIGIEVIDELKRRAERCAWSCPQILLAFNPSQLPL